MPFYFFDTHDGDTYLPDHDGQALDGIDAVRFQAQTSLADMAQDVVPCAGPDRTMVVAVRDEAGKIVLRVALVLMVEIQPELRRGPAYPNTVYLPSPRPPSNIG